MQKVCAKNVGNAKFSLYCPGCSNVRPDGLTGLNLKIILHQTEPACTSLRLNKFETRTALSVVYNLTQTSSYYSEPTDRQNLKSSSLLFWTSRQRRSLLRSTKTTIFKLTLKWSWLVTYCPIQVLKNQLFLTLFYVHLSVGWYTPALGLLLFCVTSPWQCLFVHIPGNPITFFCISIIYFLLYTHIFHPTDPQGIT